MLSKSASNRAEIINGAVAFDSPAAIARALTRHRILGDESNLLRTVQLAEARPKARIERRSMQKKCSARAFVILIDRRIDQTTMASDAAVSSQQN